MFAVYKKELKSYFLSPTGYITIGLFLLVFSLFFYLTTVSVGAYDMGNLYFNTARYGLLIIVPILTMRMFAEERKNGTEQLLLTSPRSITGIVLGKYLAAVSVIVITLIFSLIYYAILCFFKAPNFIPVLVMVLGFLLVAMAAIAIGMFISSLTENQIIAAVIIDLMSNYQKFPAGLISITEVVNLLGIAIMFVLFTIIIMQRKKSVK